MLISVVVLFIIACLQSARETIVLPAARCRCEWKNDATSR